MAQLDKRIADKDMLLRILIYGPAKSKKTWWAGKAAEAGFNVLLLDGDDGWHILKNIAPEAQKRIQVVNFTDELRRPIFATALARLLKDGKLIWDEKAKVSAKLQPNENCIDIDFSLFGKYDIVILDSWTALTRSLMLQYAKENMIDLSIAEESDDKWGYYRWAGTCATWALSQFTALPCHIINIGHVDVYEKRSKDGRTIEWTKQQVKSTSGPHAMQLPSEFSDILYFHQHKTAFKIDVQGTDEADGGSRIVAPGSYNWDNFQFSDLIAAAGLSLPPKDHPLIDYSVNAPKAKTTALKQNSKPGLVQPVKKPTAKLQLGAVSKTK